MIPRKLKSFTIASIIKALKPACGEGDIYRARNHQFVKDLMKDKKSINALQICEMKHKNLTDHNKGWIISRLPGALPAGIDRHYTIDAMKWHLDVWLKNRTPSISSGQLWYTKRRYDRDVFMIIHDGRVIRILRDGVSDASLMDPGVTLDYIASNYTFKSYVKLASLAKKKIC